MPFKKGDPKTVEAGQKGGKTGEKHFQSLPKSRLRKISISANKLSIEKRRKNRDEKDRQRAATKMVNKVMSDYIE